MEDYVRSYNGYRLGHIAGRGWSITKTVPGKFFEKVVYLAFCETEQGCIDFIDNMQ